MIKRTISAFMAAVILACCMLSTLTACSGSQDSYTTGEWLDMVEEAFNLTYYEQEAPYFTSIGSDNDLFSASQIAAEWGVVDTDQNLDLNKKVTKEFCADTLVRAMAFDYESSVEIADESEIKHPETAKVSVNEEIFSLDGSGKFKPGTVLTRNEATTALAIARDKWVNLTYDETYDNSKVRDGVVNLGGLSEDKSPVVAEPVDVSYSGSTKVIDSSGNYNISGIVPNIILPASDAAGIEPGTILTLPADDVVPTSYAVSVEEVTDNGNGTVSVKAHTVEMMDVYENLDVQFSDYLNYDDAVFFDADGNRMSDEPSTEELMDIPMQQKYSTQYLDSIADSFITPEAQLAFERLADTGTKTHSFKFGDYTGKVTYSAEKIDISIDVKLEHGKVTFKKQIPKIRFDTKLDIGWVWDWGNSGIKVKTARFVTRFEDSLSFKYSGKWSASYTTEAKDDADTYIAEKEAVLTHEEALQQAYEKFRKQYEILRKFAEKDGKVMTCELFSVVFPTGTGIDPKLVFRLNVDIEGSISLSCEAKSAFGGEVVNNKLRTINEFDLKKSATLEGKVEATVAFGLAISALGTTAADLVANAGAGVKLSVTARREDVATNAIQEECALPYGAGGVLTFKGAGELAADTPPLFADDGQTHICADFQIYPMLSLELCSSSSLIGKFIGGVKYTILDEKHGTSLIKKHIEFEGGVKFLDECSYLNEQVGGITIKSGSDLELNDEKVLIPVGGDSNYISIETLPKKYKLADFEVTCEDTSIAEVSYNSEQNYKDKIQFFPKGISIFGNSVQSSGANAGGCFYKSYVESPDDIIHIKGIADGTTTMTMKSKDGKFVKTVSVVVGNGGIEHTGAGTLSPDVYSYIVAPGKSVTVEMSTLPAGYNAADLRYTSSDSSIASVDQGGKVTGIKVGSTLITIETGDGKYSTSVEINVFD